MKKWKISKPFCFLSLTVGSNNLVATTTCYYKLVSENVCLTMHRLAVRFQRSQHTQVDSHRQHQPTIERTNFPKSHKSFECRQLSIHLFAGRIYREDSAKCYIASELRFRLRFSSNNVNHLRRRRESIDSKLLEETAGDSEIKI